VLLGRFHRRARRELKRKKRKLSGLGVLCGKIEVEILTTLDRRTIG
jgi:hypothetical protein